VHRRILILLLSLACHLALPLGTLATNPPIRGDETPSVSTAHGDAAPIALVGTRSSDSSELLSGRDRTPRPWRNATDILPAKRTARRVVNRHHVRIDLRPTYPARRLLRTRPPRAGADPA